MKILLVDDSAAMRKILIRQLNDLGFTDIIQAEDGFEGLIVLEENMPVDLILLDINMPKMDGETMLKRIRSNKKYNSVNITMVTSESEKAKVVNVLKAGATNYIIKPFNSDTLKEKLDLMK